MNVDVTDRTRRRKTPLHKYENRYHTNFYSTKQKSIALSLLLTMVIVFVANIVRVTTNIDKNKTNEELLNALTSTMNVMDNACDMRLKALFTAIVSGPTGSGKM